VRSGGIDSPSRGTQHHQHLAIVQHTIYTLEDLHLVLAVAPDQVADGTEPLKRYIADCLLVIYPSALIQILELTGI
jgi:hypothetical protein